MLHTAAALAASFQGRYPQPDTFDLQAGADPLTDPDFGGDKLETVQAGGVLNFNSAGKLKTAKALRPFLVGGETVKTHDLVEVPEADFKRMHTNGQVVEATPEEIAAAQKAAKK